MPFNYTNIVKEFGDSFAVTNKYPIKLNLALTLCATLIYVSQALTKRAG